jgi:hypothetical protein
VYRDRRKAQSISSQDRTILRIVVDFEKSTYIGRAKADKMNDLAVCVLGEAGEVGVYER